MEDEVVADEVKQDIIMALAEHILSGQIDTEDGKITEQKIEEIMIKHKIISNKQNNDDNLNNSISGSNKIKMS